MVGLVITACAIAAILGALLIRDNRRERRYLEYLNSPHRRLDELPALPGHSLRHQRNPR